MPDLIVHNLSRMSYQAALDMQQALVARVQDDGGRTAHLMLLEHDPPVITLGRRGRAEHVLADEARLAALGVEVRRTRRGGEVTWHGPGQLVAYPIVRLDTRRRTVHGHVRGLERAVIDMLRGFGIDGVRREGAFFGVNALLTKPAQSIALALLPTILEATAFVSREANQGRITLDQPPSVLLGIKMVVGLIPGVALIVGALILRAYPLRGARLEQVQREVLDLHQWKRAQL